MQYDRDKSGNLNPLPKPSIDTGMGLERLAAVLQGKHNNFDSDLFAPIVDGICRASRKAYGADSTTDTAIRVIADHIRAITFLLSEGLTPSNEGRGYVLRRIIRRASRYAKFLDIGDPVIYKLCDPVVEAMSDAYPELGEEMPRVRQMLRMEEERFNKTLEQGLSLLNSIIREVKSVQGSAVGGQDLFRLYDTYGFPLDIARDVAEENGLRIDEAGFHKEMEIQKSKARASWVGAEAGAAPIYGELLQEHGKTEFCGYETMESGSTVLAVVVNGEKVEELGEGRQGEILLDITPFYAESGGQIGDTGELSADGMRAEVVDTKKPAEGLYIHKVRVTKGVLKAGSTVRCSVDREKRLATMRNHTATHLIHSALKDLLGGHVKQAGSYVSPESLRFDFSHFSALDEKAKEALEDAVNANILKNIRVETTVEETKKAVESGATALFGEKYGDMVRVVSIPGVSSELCGGTHVSATGDIGLLKILSEGSVASGIRRIEAVTGKEAVRYFRGREKELEKVTEILKTSESPSERLRKLVAEMKELERELEKFKGRSAAESSATIIAAAREVDGLKVVAHRTDGMDAKDLRVLADSVRDGLGSGILLLASVKDDQAAMVAMVTKDLAKKFRAGDLLKKVAENAGGRGGGKPDIAQGGTKEIEKLDKALESLYEIVAKIK
jgi:alanyl-tRNA synthetase